jgi:putative membrane protein
MLKITELGFSKLRRTAHYVSLQENRMKIKALVLFALAAAPLTAFADSPDASFYKNAAEGGMFEVDAGTLAQTKGSAQGVKDFGSMMVKDHSAANDKLKGIAASKGVELPGHSSVGQMATKAKLDVLSGETFDKSYIKSQLKAHRETIGLFRKEAASGQDPDAQAFAKATLPTLRTHLKAITTLAADAGISTK